MLKSCISFDKEFLGFQAVKTKKYMSNKVYHNKWSNCIYSYGPGDIPAHFAYQARLCLRSPALLWDEFAHCKISYFFRYVFPKLYFSNMSVPSLTRRC